MHRTLRAHRQRDERGASAVEFALVLPLLLMLLFGMISTGRVVSDHLAATNAVREGARYGAATNVSDANWSTSVRDRVKEVYFDQIQGEPEDDEICVRLVQAAGTTPSGAETIGADCGTAPTLPGSMAPGSCAVLVWMQRPATIQLLVFPDLTLDVGAQSVAFYGREVGTTCTAS